MYVGHIIMLYTSTYRVVCVNYISINWKEINLMYNLQKKKKKAYFTQNECI